MLKNPESKAIYDFEAPPTVSIRKDFDWRRGDKKILELSQEESKNSDSSETSKDNELTEKEKKKLLKLL